MENIKPEDILQKHIGTMCVIDNRILTAAMREYAQIACSTLSEEIRVKDNRIESLTKALESAKTQLSFVVHQGNNIVTSLREIEKIDLILTPPTNP